MRASIKPWAVFLIVFAIYFATKPKPNLFIDHTMQANAIWHGHIYIDPFSIHEQVTFNNHRYTLHPPLAGWVMCLAYPYFINHLLIAQQWTCIALGAAAATLVYIMMGPWLAAFFAFGTPVWWEAVNGTSWGFCLVLGTVPTLLALRHCWPVERESAAGGGIGADVVRVPDYSAIWAGWWAGLAGLARYDLFLAAPFYLGYAVFQHPDVDQEIQGERKQNQQVTFHFLLGLLPAISAYVVWSYLRFHSPIDKALWLWWAQDKYRSPHAGNPSGPFSLHYLPWNLYTALFMAPIFSAKFPWFLPWGMGEALLFTSPALLLCLRARWRQPRSWLLLVAALAVMAPALTVYANGFKQLGDRYWIMAIPFLIALIPPKMDRMSRGLIVTSIILTGYGFMVARIYDLAGAQI